jgi:hypothetical protein
MTQGVAASWLPLKFIAAANTFVQLAAAPGMRGRMMGLWTMALPGSEPVTGPSVGWVTRYVGPREGFGLAGLVLAVVASVGWGRTNTTLTVLLCFVPIFRRGVSPDDCYRQFRP